MTQEVHWTVTGAPGRRSGVSLVHPSEEPHEAVVRAFQRNSGLMVDSITEDRTILVIGEDYFLRLRFVVVEKLPPRISDRIQSKKRTRSR